MGMIAALTLQATPPLEEVAHLRLVDTLGDSKFRLAVSKATIFAIIAIAVLHEGLAQLRFFKVGLLAQLCSGVGIAAISTCTLAALEKVAHLRLCQSSCNRIVACFGESLISLCTSIASLLYFGSCRPNVRNHRLFPLLAPASLMRQD
jgi:hypothetical protein